MEYKYDAWGKVSGTTTAMGCEVLAEMEPFRYRGYVYDVETQFYYLKHRYYNPYFLRFIFSDAILGCYDSLYGANIFIYGENDPINNTDYNGFLTVSTYSKDFLYTDGSGNGSALAFLLFVFFTGSFLGSKTTDSEQIKVWTSLEQYETNESLYKKTNNEDQRTNKRQARLIRCRTRKEAYEQAKKAGKGAEPELHDSKEYGPHYHPHVKNDYSRTPHEYNKHDHYYFPKNRFIILFLFDEDDSDREYDFFHLVY